MDDPVEVIEIFGFDPDGDPEIRLMADGSMWVAFNFMPPTWLPESDGVNLGVCQDFDKQMEEAIKVKVLWDDREFFYIKQPRQDTVEAVKLFLAKFRELHDPS